MVMLNRSAIVAVFAIAEEYQTTQETHDIQLWNGLPAVIIDDPTVPTFASGINKFYTF